MSLLTAIFKSLELLLLLLNKSYYNDLREKSKVRQKNLKEEIEKLRDIGDSNSSDRADLLRKELRAEIREFEYLSTLDPSLGKGSPDTNG
jgi:hypothetical protein